MVQDVTHLLIPPGPIVSDVITPGAGCTSGAPNVPILFLLKYDVEPALFDR